MTARSVAATAQAAFGQRRRFMLPSALPYRRALGVLLVGLLVIANELLGRPSWLDPAILVPAAVLGATALGGPWSGVAATALGTAYLVLYYAQAAAVAPVGGLARVLASVAASAVAMWVATYLDERGKAVGANAAVAGRRAALIGEFAGRLANATPAETPAVLADGAAALLGADMAVLTVLDAPSGRHFVRAAYGGTTSPVGVEVLHGVGITGQAIRERRVIVAGGADTTNAEGLSRRLRGKSAQTLAAAPGIHAGRVIACLTVGRHDGRQFTKDDLGLLAAIASLMTLAVVGSVLSDEVEHESPRDHLTGLYSRAYLEAVLEQILALRHRTPSAERPAMALIMFDIDGFALINERYGRMVGDSVLRAVATLLKQRFRASDVVARIADDSFFAVLNGATMDGAAEAASLIRRQVRELNVRSPRGEPVAVSISVATSVIHDDEKPDVLIKSVQTALETGRLSASGAAVPI